MATDITAFPIQNLKTTELTTASTLDGTEAVDVVQSSTTRQTTIADIQTYISEQRKGFAQYYMVGNSTVTSISTTGVFVKVAGTTTQGEAPDNFNLTDNRATYTQSTTAKFKVTGLLTFTSGGNNSIEVRVAKNGVTQARGTQAVETGGSGNAENVVVKDVVELSSATDYIEIFVANATDTGDVTVVDLMVVIERLA